MKIKVKEIGQVCEICVKVYPVEKFPRSCCEGMPLATGYETTETPIYVVLESELNENYEIIK